MTKYCLPYNGHLLYCYIMLFNNHLLVRHSCYRMHKSNIYTGKKRPIIILRKHTKGKSHVWSDSYFLRIG